MLTLDIFHTSMNWWSFNGVRVTTNSPQVSRTLLGILADLNSAVIWIVLSLPLISRTLLSILANLNTAVIWIVLSLPLISRTLLSNLVNINSAVVLRFSILLISHPSNFFSKLLVSVPSALTIIGITITYMFHSFCVLWVRLKYLLTFLLSEN